MTRILAIDTETTGFPKKYGALMQEGQARVCQIAMLLCDEKGKSLAEFSALLKPEGWKVGEEAGKVHGFTTDQCAACGVSSKAAYLFYRRLAEMADVIIAHNSSFDRKMMDIEAAYHGYQQVERPWKCTMEMTVDVCNIPPTEKMLAAGMNRPKSPKLDEALQKVCGKSLGDTAHDALWDVRACKDIWFGLMKEAA